MIKRKIVDSMTLDDILDLYIQDATPFIGHKLQELHKKYVKLLYNSHKDIYFFEPITVKRSCGLNIVFQYVDRGTSYPKDKRLSCFLFSWFLYKGSIYALQFLTDNRQGILFYFYTSHFINRYRERCLKDSTIPLTEALLTYIRNNYKTIAKKVSSSRHPDCCWMPYNEGLCFCAVKPKRHKIPTTIVIFKTIIAWEQLNNRQEGIACELFKEGLKKGFDIKVPETLLDKFNDTDIPSF